MKTISTVIYIACAIGLVAFAYALWLQTRKAKSGTSAARRFGRKPHAGSAGVTAGAMLALVPKLRQANAQWPQIMAALNPSGDERAAELLQTIRGPHMFDPRTALGVIEAGCRETPGNAPGAQALAAAVNSMNKVVGFGR